MINWPKLVEAATVVRDIENGTAQTWTLAFNDLRGGFLNPPRRTQGILGRASPVSTQYWHYDPEFKKLNVYATGVSGAIGGAVYFRGYAAGRRRDFGLFNAEAITQAESIYANIRQAIGTSLVDQINWYGYSAGGAIGEAFLRVWRYRNTHTAVMLIDTWGSPAAADSGSYMSVPSGFRHRFFRRNDAVPFLPTTRLRDGSIVSVVQAGHQYVENAAYVQPGQGIQLETVGVRYANNPSTNSDNPELALSSWFNSIEPYSSAHRNDAYLRDFQRMLAIYGGWGPEPTNTEPPSPPITPVEVQVARELLPPRIGASPTVVTLNRTTIAMNRIGRSPGKMVFGAFPTMYLRVNPKKAFRKVKVGDQWQVRLGEQVVLASDTKYLPAAFVKAGNRMLRSVGLHNTVYLNNLIAGLQDWLQNAAVDETYCKPTMRVDI